MEEEQIKRALHPIADMRLRARFAWRGPVSLEWGDQDAPYYGWPILYLEMKNIEKDQINTRIVYGHLYAEDHLKAVLRAVYWDGKFNREQARLKNYEHVPKIAARFVEIDRIQVQDWLSQFNELKYNINTQGSQDGGGNVPVRVIRAEMDYASSVFEFVWESNAEPFKELNERWGSVWDSMGQALKNTSALTRFSEDFWDFEKSFEYALDKYPLGSDIT